MKTFVLTGPESTGKTWLSGLLAGHFNTTWRPEYLREYFDTNNAIKKEEMVVVAMRQIEREKDLLEKDFPFVFFDTNIISLKIYYQHYFKEEPEWFHQLYDESLYNHYFLLDTDIPWIEDEQRDSPEVRQKLFHDFRTELENLNLPYTLVGGSYKERGDKIKKEVERVTTLPEN